MSPRIGLNLQMVIQAAAELANEKGLHAVTTSELAKALNIRPPSLYNHIASLADLHREMGIHGLHLLYNELLHASAGRAGEEAIMAMVDAYYRFANTHPGLYEATLDAGNPQDEQRQQISQQMLALFARPLESYHLSGDALIHAIRGLRSLMHGFSSLERSGGFGIDLDVNTSQQMAVTAYLAGLLHTSSS